MPLVKTSDDSAAPVPHEAESTVMELCADLAARDPKLRHGAARRLGVYPETATILASAVCTETLGSVREMIFTSLMRMGTRPAAAGLVPLLQSEDVGLRNGAMEALKTMPEVAAECLGEIFASDSDVRIFGVEILSGLPSSNRLYWLKRVVQEESEINVCAVAVDTLVRPGDREAASPLHQLLERFPEEPFLEFSVRSALSRIKGNGVAEPG
jgi:HEAT repeat protein